MPWGIALNEKTNECAGYWGGDEFRFNPLPEGWIAIYSWSDNWNKISGVEECGLQGKDTSLYSKLCCDKLGYRYVSENIGKQNIIEKNNNTIIILIGGAVTSIVIFMLFRLIKNRK